MAYTLSVNGRTRRVDVEPDTPLLWVLRDTLGILGPKFGCGIAQCGACTVHIDGAPVRACALPIEAVGKGRVTTIEAIGDSEVGARVQKAWSELDVAQCGYCQPGQIMAAAAALAGPTPPPAQTLEDIGNICRCGTYARIGAAIALARQRGVSA
jgi:isoquinoline 1-oxidoreductase alpha subunit